MINQKKFIAQVNKLELISMLRSDLCDYSDAYIVVKGTVTVTNHLNHLKIMHHL